ncbi:AAA ATPase-like protein [Pseudonocardia hierapolitana]|uniref:AAA ATPase-like protein n=2 Tax=Pseudonocardia hierapolitana TaxID=1128676 RepID=A0A561SRL5_9PSEU|nr:AAA ATPase-like protein [Pseudonocardia hierapolitana]
MGDAVAVDFPLAAPDVLLRAEAEVSHPLEDEGGGDITVLSLTGELPPGLDPPRLIVADDVWGHPFRAFGFPRRFDQGVWAAGVLRAPQGTGWVQMEGGASGYSVEAGFSGGAVWDDELAGVVGMTVAADARPDLRTAFLIPSATLMRAWPRLVERTLLPCPYRGLYPFRSSDTALFFGREDVTDRLVREALRRPLLAVAGPSGSGKSSVVFAGVVPRLGREPRWMSVSMRPAQASSPLFALAAALIPVLEPELGETERLSAANALVTVLRDGHLSDVVDRVLARAQLDHLLLVVDQMEELFAREQDEVQSFTRALLSAARSGQQPPGSRSLTILLTLRVDFLSNALQDPGLAEALEDSVITIGQMRQEQLRTVIEGPLPSGIRYEAGLVERILGDVGDGSGSAPPAQLPADHAQAAASSEPGRSSRGDDPTARANPCASDAGSEGNGGVEQAPAPDEPPVTTAEFQALADPDSAADLGEAADQDGGSRTDPDSENAPPAATVRSGFQLDPGQDVFAYVHGAWHPAIVASRDRRTVVVDYQLNPGPLGARRQRVTIDRVRLGEPGA